MSGSFIFSVLAILWLLVVPSHQQYCCNCRNPRKPVSPAVEVDLQNNLVRGSDNNIVWENRLTRKPGTCASQGKLRLSFNSNSHPNQPRQVARIDLWFASEVTGFSFDIGDSPTVNGWGGDAGTTSNAAEVHGLNRNLLIYTNILSGYLLYSTDNHLLVENKANALSDHVTLYISNERVEVNNYRGYQAVYDSKYLFTLNGQRPLERYRYARVEYDVWLSMNRVISGSYRSGTGLCKVAISWLQSC